MIAADTGTWGAFLEGNSVRDVQLLDRALEDRQVVMVPVVLTELLSDAELPSHVARRHPKIQRAAVGRCSLAESCCTGELGCPFFVVEAPSPR